MHRLSKYKRIMIKISGEGLMGDQSSGLNKEMVDNIAKDITRPLPFIIPHNNIIRISSVSFFT